MSAKGYYENCELAANKAVREISRMIPKPPIKISDILYACPTCSVGVFRSSECCKWCRQVLMWDN